MKKELLFSVIPGRDLIFKTDRSGGPGGQHANKTDSAVRLSHPESGCEVRVTDEKSQHRNKRIALKRLVNHPKFRSWVRLKASMIAEGFRSIEDKVTQMMRPENTKIEYVHTFTCDECRRTAQVISDNPQPPWDELPHGWVSDKCTRHYCHRCQKRIFNA